MLDFIFEAPLLPKLRARVLVPAKDFSRQFSFFEVAD